MTVCGIAGPDGSGSGIDRSEVPTMSTALRFVVAFEGVQELALSRLEKAPIPVVAFQRAFVTATCVQPESTWVVLEWTVAVV